MTQKPSAPGTMSRASTLSSNGATVLALLLLSTSTAWADERTCRGTLGAITVDNLRVPQYATCTLNGTRVKGTIKVEWNATLRASDVIVIGNVQAENARHVSVLEDSSVGGSVQVVQGGSATVSDSHVKGDILYDANTAQLHVLRNRIGGNVQAFQNNGGVNIRRNVIDGNLQCKENTPAPVGRGNIVGGNKEDQCARL